MSFVQELEAKFSHLKDVAEGDLHSLVLKLEAIFSRVHVAEVSHGLKQAVSADVHAALEHASVIAGAVEAKAAVVDEAVEQAEQAVKAAVTKKTSALRK